MADAFGAQGEYRELFKQAQLGQKYRSELEDSVVRLGLSLELGVAEPVLRGVARNAGVEDLTALKEGMQRKLEEMLPVTTQLGGSRCREAVETGYLI